MCGPAPPSPLPGNEEPEEILRGKYLDYCSARVADILLRLSPDEIYLLAQEAARESALPPGELGFAGMVLLAMERVSHRLALPSFEAWRQEYLLDPGRFEGEFLGLWEIPAPTAGVSPEPAARPTAPPLEPGKP